jgi:hypothetical protein
LFYTGVALPKNLEHGFMHELHRYANKQTKTHTYTHTPTHKSTKTHTNPPHPHTKGRQEFSPAQEDWGGGGLNPGPFSFLEVLRDPKMGYTSEPSLLRKLMVSLIYIFNGSNF